MGLPARTRSWSKRRRVVVGGGALAMALAAAALAAVVGTAPAGRAAPPSPAAPAGPAAQPPCERRTFEDVAFTICTLDTQRGELRLASRGRTGMPLRSFAALSRELGDDSRHVAFAMNAGMFDADGAPIGLLISAGATLHPLNTGDGSGNFYLRPNGVLSVDRDGTIHVEPTAAYAARHPDPAWATQSGPMLVIDGAIHPAIAPDGSSRTIRNGVGARDAHTALFAISEAPVSFGRFARLFRDELHCTSALYLDGAVSSAWIPGADRRDADHALGPLAVILANRRASTGSAAQ